MIKQLNKTLREAVQKPYGEELSIERVPRQTTHLGNVKVNVQEDSLMSGLSREDFIGRAAEIDLKDLQTKLQKIVNESPLGIAIREDGQWDLKIAIISADAETADTSDPRPAIALKYVVGLRPIF